MRVEVPEILRDLSEDSDAAKLLKSYYYSTSQTRRVLFSGSRFTTSSSNGSRSDGGNYGLKC